MAVLSARLFALDSRIIALALVLAIVSMPMVCGSIVMDSHSAITMDICHPVQSADAGGAASFAPLPRLLSMPNTSRDAVLAIADTYDSLAGRLGEAPALPPPETLA